MIRGSAVLFANVIYYVQSIADNASKKYGAHFFSYEAQTHNHELLQETRER